jgi:hypothetical protein
MRRCVVAWLTGVLNSQRSSSGFVVARLHPDVARRVEKILKHRELVQFLAVIERRNKDKKARFRLGAHLFQVIMSVHERLTTRSKMPALDQPNADVRAHFQDVSTKSKRLAKLLRQAFQPKIALAAYSEDREALRLFEPFPIIQGSTGYVTIVPLDRLLAEAAALLDSRAREISRASTHRRRAKNPSEAGQQALRERASTVLTGAFRRALDRPYHSQVATITSLISGIRTNEDYVKKLEMRERRTREVKGQIQRKL